MTELRIKRRSFNIYLFNVKISPREKGEDSTQLYSDLLKKIHSENIAIKTRGDKFMELRTLHSYGGNEDEHEVLYGSLIYYTVLDPDAWYNKRSREIQSVDLDTELNPNAKEAEYFFIPKAHRFCYVTKSNGIALSQVEEFLKGAFNRVIEEERIVIVTKELSQDVIERILSAKSLSRLQVNLSYSNNDLTPEFNEYFLDNDLREGQVRNLELSAKSFVSESIDLANSKVLNAALRLSQSNGYAEAVIKNEDGKNERIATTEYPRKELIFSSEGNEPKTVLHKVLRIFRRHGKEK